jgi:hypothetical protein
MEDTIVESPMDAPNDTIAGSEALLIKALPEHRIVAIHYKERIVWDRQNKMDLVFGGKGDGGGIYQIIETYNEWKEERDQVLEWNRQRQVLVAERIPQILGVERFAQLESLSSSFELVVTTPQSSNSNNSDSDDDSDNVVESYVQRALELFRQVRNDPTPSLQPSWIPTSDYLALDELSEFVAVLPNVEWRSMLLTEIARCMDRFERHTTNTTTNQKKQSSSSQQASSSTSSNNNNNNNNRPELLEDDLTETFVRGSGPGGQKVNKTSNRVVLVHGPTQLRVECQDTRSLQQNRKIARKRLLEKLDEQLNGSQSKVIMKQAKASQKKKQVKTKNRARQRKKQLEKEQQQLQEPSQQEEDAPEQWS